MKPLDIDTRWAYVQGEHATRRVFQYKKDWRVLKAAHGDIVTAFSNDNEVYVLAHNPKESRVGLEIFYQYGPEKPRGVAFSLQYEKKRDVCYRSDQSILVYKTDYRGMEILTDEELVKRLLEMLK